MLTVDSSQMVHFKAALVSVGGPCPHALVQTWADRTPEAPEPTATEHAGVRRLHSLIIPSKLGSDNGFSFAFHLMAYESELPLAQQLHDAVDHDVDAVVLSLGSGVDQTTRISSVASIEAWLRASGHVAPERCPLVVARRRRRRADDAADVAGRGPCRQRAGGDHDGRGDRTPT